MEFLCDGMSMWYGVPMDGYGVPMWWYEHVTWSSYVRYGVPM